MSSLDLGTKICNFTTHKSGSWRQKITLSNYACLPPLNKGDDDNVGVKALVAGWGRINGTLLDRGVSRQEVWKYATPPSNVLRDVEGTVISRDVCQQKWNPNNYKDQDEADLANDESMFIHGSQLCVDYPAGRGACAGDSGGPVTYRRADNRHVLIGVVSWGPRPCGVKFPSALQVYFIESIFFSGSQQTRYRHKCGILQGLDRQGTKRKSRILSAINEIWV